MGKILEGLETPPGAPGREGRGMTEQRGSYMPVVWGQQDWGSTNPASHPKQEVGDGLR